MSQTERTIEIYTGLEGYKLFKEQMDRSGAIHNVTSLRENNDISEEEKKSLIEMINSPDIENLKVAEAIIHYHIISK